MRVNLCWLSAVLFSAVQPKSRNWRNAYIVSLSKGLRALESQAALVASREPCMNRAFGGSN
jgi:hypothetical protein